MIVKKTVIMAKIMLMIIYNYINLNNNEDDKNNICNNRAIIAIQINWNDYNNSKNKKKVMKIVTMIVMIIKG